MDRACSMYGRDRNTYNILVEYSEGKKPLGIPGTDGSIILQEVLVKVKVMSRPTVSRSVHLGVKHPFGTKDQIFVSVRQLRVC
jgi:hypothetical protein